MAAHAAAALLDELMGKHRNALPNEKIRETRWDDYEVCKHYLVKFCPNELFVNTKADLGPCPKLHDPEFKKDYSKASSYKKQIYEDEFLKFCDDLLVDVERKIKKGKQRLALANKSEVIAINPSQKKLYEEKLLILTDKINNLLKEVERMGSNGNVEEAQGLLKLCDQLKVEKESIKQKMDVSKLYGSNDIPFGQEKQMEVCEICGAFLIVGDAQQRVDDHLMGKQHMGYAKLRSAVEDIQKEQKKRKEEYQKEKDERKRKAEEEENKRKKSHWEDDRKKDSHNDHHSSHRIHSKSHSNRRENSHRSDEKTYNSKEKSKQIDKFKERKEIKVYKKEGIFQTADAKHNQDVASCTEYFSSYNQ